MALKEFLERERASFPRFYFVGDDDLLEIIEKAVESRTRDYLGDWEKNKPVEGRRRPKKAVERFQLFEAKYSSLNEERDKVGKAKEALEPQETGPISTNEERMQVNNNKILVEFFYVCVILIGLFFFVFFYNRLLTESLRFLLHHAEDCTVGTHLPLLKSFKILTTMTTQCCSMLIALVTLCSTDLIYPPSRVKFITKRHQSTQRSSQQSPIWTVGTS